MPTEIRESKSTPAESKAYIKFIEESFCVVLAQRHGLKKSIRLVLEAPSNVDASSLGELFGRGYQHRALL